jgi:ABC-2 type transport system ATP-binding protein
VIEAVQLTKIFNGVTAVDGLDLTIKPGEVFCLLGANGAGKTTTINLFLNFIQPASGEARISGMNVVRHPVETKQRLAYIPEQVTLYRNLTGIENLRFFSRLAKADVDSDQELLAVLRQCGLTEEQVRRRVGTYSKGMRQKIGIAMTVAKKAEALLLDEPTSGLDPIGIREMKDMILRLRDQGKTIVMSSHQLGDVEDVCDRIAILHQGELKELGRVEELLTVQDVTQVKAKGLSKACEEEIRAVIAKHGGQVLEVDHPTLSLEELFLNIVRDSEARPGRRAGVK